MIDQRGMAGACGDMSMFEIDAPELIEKLIKQAESLTPDRRDLIVLLFTFFGGVCLIGGHVCISPLGPMGMAATFLLFDPVGLLGLAAAAFVARPHGRFAARFRKALGHSKYGLGSVAILTTAGLLNGLAWFVWELLR